MSDFLDTEADESEEEAETSQAERKKAKRSKNVRDSSEEDEDDDEKLQEELKDLIDDAPIDDESEAEDSDGSGRAKRKVSDDEEYDDRLEDEDYDLIEENLGVKVERRRFKRLRRVEDEESDNEEARDQNQERDAIAMEIFSDDDKDEPQDDERRSERGQAQAAEPEHFGEEEDEDDYSDADDFIVDDDGRPITDKKKKRKPIFTDAALQEAQETFGVDFDYDDFSKYERDEYEDEDDEEDEYVDDDEEERRRRPKKAARQKPSRKTIFELYEPSELKRGFFTDLDNEIRNTDAPERLQLRDVPITPVAEDSSELNDEAEWIYRQAFCHPTISSQEDDGGDGRDRHRKGPQTVGKIRKALDFMRNQWLEVPFIAFYRKEYVQPELSISDLWKVYHYDAKWCQLKTRKQNLMRLFEKMRTFQVDQLMLTPDAPIPEHVRVMQDADVERLAKVETPEELQDVYNHFILYYATDLPRMHDAWRLKQREQRKAEKRQMRAARREAAAAAADGGGALNGDLQDDDEDDDEEDEEAGAAEASRLKYANRAGSYALCSRAGIGGFAKRFGMTPDQLAENVRDSYQRHEIDQEAVEPREIAKAFVCARFPSVDDVLEAVTFMVALQIAREPLLRACVREAFRERAKISVRPTRKGAKVIDELHACYAMKYVRAKPARDFAGEQYLKLALAEDEQLLAVSVDDALAGNAAGLYVDEVKQLYLKDEFSKHVQAWNALRAECVERALARYVFPDLRAELKRTLRAEAQHAVLKACCRRLYNWLKVAPIGASCGGAYDDAGDTSKGVRAMAIAYVPDYAQAAFACVAAPDGDVSDYLRLPHLVKRKSAAVECERLQKEADLTALRTFIFTKRPHVIVIGGESRDAVTLADEVRALVADLVELEQFTSVGVEVVDNELAKVYANSAKSVADFRDYPELLRQAVSLARKVQDPLVEYAQLCTADDELLSLRFHPLQEHVGRDELLEALHLEFVNRTNEVGVDVNLAVQQPHKSHLVQFVCGLGPRKGQALLRVLKQTNQRLENRTQLVTACHMGPKVFINCSGFVKIDTNSLGDSTEAYVEILDGTRVHPETYEWARKMAVDALEYDDDEGANPAGALEEILETPERLKDLDLDAFAEELERQGFGNKSITLYDIRAELNCRYKDLRTPFASASGEELFDMLTKESPETLYVGKLLTATVTGVSRRKPQGEQLDQANPLRNEETGLWQCPFCLQKDFPELSDVWNHFDAGACCGQATGVRLRLDNGISGYIHIKNLSDHHVANPEERVTVGQLIHCRIMKIDVERFSVDCTCKSSDLVDKNREWRPTKDLFYDHDAEERDARADKCRQRRTQKATYVKRVIIHPSFHNINFSETEKLMLHADQGEVVVRPSSKSTDHLTITWKVAADVCQHIDVREEGKLNAFSLGTSLWIRGEEFEDLDEIIARFVNPMAALARDALSFRYYRDTNGGSKERAELLLRDERKKNTTKIHYIISASKQQPGKFLLSYLPRHTVQHEFISLSPEGFRFRGQLFDSMPGLFKWFKEHFRDPLPALSQTPATPRAPAARPSYTSATPTYSADTRGVTFGGAQQPLAASSGHPTTPHFPHTPAAYAASNFVTTPYTPSGQTPFMTPFQTPRYEPQHQHTAAAVVASGTPHLNGTFLHPAAVAAAAHQRTPAYRNHVMQSPATSALPSPAARNVYDMQKTYASDSPRSFTSDSSRRSYVHTAQALDWQKAAEAWARSVPAALRADGRSTPRSMGQRTPKYEEIRSDIERMRQKMCRSPRSVRSTPRTNTSPHSMSLGDATPLYDESI